VLARESATDHLAGRDAKANANDDKREPEEGPAERDANQSDDDEHVYLLWRASDGTTSLSR